jgi:hypothetical protein
MPLLPSFLLYDHLITDDPVFQEATPDHHQSRIQKQALGVKEKQSINRDSLKNKLKYFSELSLLIEAGLLHVIPLSLLHLPPDKLPIFFSEDRFRSEIPEGIHNFVHSKAKIQEVLLEKESGSLLILDKPRPEISRAIYISFEGDGPNQHGMIYFLDPFDVLETDRETSTMHVAIKSDLNLPISEDLYRSWVYQSVNQTILARLRNVASEISLARTMGYTYLTESLFESKLLGASTTQTDAGMMVGAVNFLRASETMIAIDKASSVLKLRERNKQAFERFRSTILELSEQLTGLSDDEFNIKARRLFLTNIQPQIDEIKKAAASIITSATKGDLVSLGGIALVLTTGSTIPFISAALFTTSGVFAEALPSISEYLQKRRGPEYIWSELVK